MTAILVARSWRVLLLAIVVVLSQSLAVAGAWLVWSCGYAAAKGYTGTLAAILWIGVTVRMGWRDGRGVNDLGTP